MSDKPTPAGSTTTTPPAPSTTTTTDILAAKSKPPLPNIVVVHPLVLLSVVDHYTRVARDTNRRVVGVLLGEQQHGQLDITNSYAVPFEEDTADNNIWYIDRQYHEDMFAMFKKVNARERVVGWYSTGPKIRSADLQITELLREYCPQPVLVIIDVNPKQTTVEIPTEAYVSIDIEADSQLVSASAAAMTKQSEQKMDVEDSKQQHQQNTADGGTSLRKQFVHLPSKIEALEAEEVGVEHLLRGIRDVSASTLSDQIRGKLDSLKGLKNRLNDMIKYLQLVAKNTIPVNHSIMYKIQDILNLLPDVNVNKGAIKQLTVENNDNYMIMYLSALIRSITALHDLIHNKLLNRQIENEEHEKLMAERKRQREQKKLEAEQAEKSKHDTAGKTSAKSGEESKEETKTNEADMKK